MKLTAEQLDEVLGWTYGQGREWLEAGRIMAVVLEVTTPKEIITLRVSKGSFELQSVLM